MYAEVCFPFSITKTFSYGIPNQLQAKIKPGDFVVVQFRSKPITGLIVALSSNIPFTGKVNDIISINRNYSIPNELWQTLQWMQNYYVTPIGKIAQVTLSWAFKKRLVEQKKIKHIKLKNLNFDNQKFTDNQQFIINFLLKNKNSFTPLSEFKSQLKYPYSILKQLQAKNLIIEKNQTIKEKFCSENMSPIDKIKLTKKQEHVYQSMHKNFKNNNKPHFLHGITGSGKTEIYLKIAYDFINNKKSCLVLVPEITLSIQLYNRFKEYFNQSVLLWHSKISDQAKNKAWQKMKNKESFIIIGARSALFAPLHNLGLIIVDEEHDGSYKESERQPSYNARDMAVIRGKFSKSMVLLGSATPSLESYYNSTTNKYYLYELNERYGDAILPAVQLVDMSMIKDSFILQPMFSDLTINCIQEKLKNKEQILILHNRRGFASLRVSDQSDGVLKCPKCDIILTFHQHINQLICHHCHFTKPMSSFKTENDNTQITYSGYGTEKLQLALNKLFPKASILRMDADSANSMSKQSKILNKFKKGQGDILLGTQMIAKGLDFENITLVVVVNADLGMYVPDFKSHEQMFQLIYQVIGRAGRSNKQSQAIIQTYNPDNKVIQMATQYNLKKFYNIQLKNRKDLSYPPFIRLIRIIFKSADIQKCQSSAMVIYDLLCKSFSSSLIGPLPCPIEKLSNKFRYHIIIKASHSKFGIILKEINNIQNQKEVLISNQVTMLIDIDANSVL